MSPQNFFFISFIHIKINAKKMKYKPSPILINTSRNTWYTYNPYKWSDLKNYCFYLLTIVNKSVITISTPPDDGLYMQYIASSIRLLAIKATIIRHLKDSYFINRCNINEQKSTHSFNISPENISRPTSGWKPHQIQSKLYEKIHTSRHLRKDISSVIPAPALFVPSDSDSTVRPAHHYLPGRSQRPFIKNRPWIMQCQCW